MVIGHRKKIRIDREELGKDGYLKAPVLFHMI